MREGAKNGMRSGLVVIGALAFGYLTLQLGFKPYLEKAQLLNHQPNDLSQDQEQEQEHGQVVSSASDDVAAIVLNDGSPS